MSLEATEQMVPHAVKRKVGLTHIKHNAFIPKQIQVQVPPRGRTILDQQEALKRDFNVFNLHLTRQHTLEGSDRSFRYYIQAAFQECLQLLSSEENIRAATK